MSERPTVFTTERLIARDWSLEDAEAVHDMYGRDEVVRFIGGARRHGLEDARDYLAFLIERNAGWPEGYGSYPVFLAEDGRLAGTAICKLLPDRDEQPSEDTEIGWHLHPEVWGRGLATEMGQALIERAFGLLDLDEVHAVVDPENHRSCAVARRLGMQPLGRCTDYYGGKEVEHFLLRRE